MKPPAPVTSTVICGAPCVWPVPWHDCCAFSRSSGMYARCRVPGRNQDREESQDVVTNKKPEREARAEASAKIGRLIRQCMCNCQTKKEGLRSPWNRTGRIASSHTAQCVLPRQHHGGTLTARMADINFVQNLCSPHLADRRQAHVHVSCVAPRCLLADRAQRVILDGPLEVLHVHGVALEPPP